MNSNTDYIYFPNAKIVGGNYSVGTFIGFKDCLIFIPDKSDEWGHRADTIHSFTFKGKLPSEAVVEILNDKTLSSEEKKEIFKSMIPKDWGHYLPITSEKRMFKISHGWLPFMRTISYSTKDNWIPVQITIKDKAFLISAKEFYKNQLT